MREGGLGVCVSGDGLGGLEEDVLPFRRKGRRKGFSLVSFWDLGVEGGLLTFWDGFWEEERGKRVTYCTWSLCCFGFGDCSSFVSGVLHVLPSQDCRSAVGSIGYGYSFWSLL